MAPWPNLFHKLFLGVYLRGEGERGHIHLGLFVGLSGFVSFGWGASAEGRICGGATADFCGILLLRLH